MKIYRISCYSDCGSYFGAYLKSLTIIAESPDAAKELAKNWQRENEPFIYSESKWEIMEVSSKIENGVIDYQIDSDY